jgi:hypothetical protein
VGPKHDLRSNPVRTSATLGALPLRATKLLAMSFLFFLSSASPLASFLPAHPTTTPPPRPTTFPFTDLSAAVLVACTSLSQFSSTAFRIIFALLLKNSQLPGSSTWPAIDTYIGARTRSSFAIPGPCASGDHESFGRRGRIGIFTDENA